MPRYSPPIDPRPNAMRSKLLRPKRVTLSDYAKPRNPSWRNNTLGTDFGVSVEHRRAQLTLVLQAFQRVHRSFEEYLGDTAAAMLLTRVHSLDSFIEFENSTVERHMLWPDSLVSLGTPDPSSGAVRFEARN